MLPRAGKVFGSVSSQSHIVKSTVVAGGTGGRQACQLSMSLSPHASSCPSQF
jgi:hypothetical protein